MFQNVSKANEASTRWFYFRILILLSLLSASVLFLVSFSPNIHVTAANVDKVVVNEKEEVDFSTRGVFEKGSFCCVLSLTASYLKTIKIVWFHSVLRYATF